MHELKLTDRERYMLIVCLRGEVEADDGHHGDYMRALKTILRKLRGDK